MKESKHIYWEEAGPFPKKAVLNSIKEYQDKYNEAYSNIRDMIGDVLYGTETKPQNIILMTGRNGMKQLNLSLRYEYMKNHKVDKRLFEDKRFRNTFEKIYGR